MAQSHRMYPYRAADGRFYNHAGESLASHVMHPICMYIGSWFTRTTHHVPAREWVYDAPPVNLHEHEAEEPLIIPLGHATVLIRMGGMTFITDPIFGSASFLFRRETEFPYGRNQTLPHVDAVLISHNHRDHLDAPSIRALQEVNPNLAVYVPQGDRAWCIQKGMPKSFEALWWDSFELATQSGSVKLTFLPARHWSQRGLFDRNYSLWGSWMIETSTSRVYFGGDTAYGRHFKSIQQEYGAIDVALLPIAPCDPHEWLSDTHIDDKQAIQAFCDLNAQVLIPVHWGVYWFGIEHPFSPIQRLRDTWMHRSNDLVDRDLVTPKFGQPFCYKTYSDERRRSVYVPVHTPPTSEDTSR